MSRSSEVPRIGSSISDLDDIEIVEKKSEDQTEQNAPNRSQTSVKFPFDNQKSQTFSWMDAKGVAAKKSKFAEGFEYSKSDSSVYPSYTNLTLPYRVICRQRYQNAINMHHEQFIKEIRLHEKLQPYALGGCRLRREFCDPILNKVSSKDIVSLTLDEERRLEYILKTDPKDL